MSSNATDLNDRELMMLISRILFEHGKASVGKLGSLMHSYTNNHRLSAMCKEKYGGLKKFLEAHSDLFAIGADHPFNPSVWLLGTSSSSNQIQNSNSSSSSNHNLSSNSNYTSSNSHASHFASINTPAHHHQQQLLKMPF
jgi:hypothetical protein